MRRAYLCFLIQFRQPEGSSRVSETEDRLPPPAPNLLDLRSHLRHSLHHLSLFRVGSGLSRGDTSGTSRVELFVPSRFRLAQFLV